MSNRQRGSNQAGAILIVIMIGVAIASIALGAAVQAWSTTWRRDSEEELIFRGTQYVNAILAYQKEHGGQYPVRLEDLYTPGPRRLRYIRKLYKDPIQRDGKWGLLYLMPGGRGVYDPKAAQKAQDKAASEGWGDGADGSATAQTGVPGLTPFPGNAFGSGVPGPGVPGAGGLVPGALPTGALAPPLLAAPPGSAGKEGEELVSEPPLGWPIVGVISRAQGALADKTYKVYKSHLKIDEWQFQVFDFGGQQPPVPAPAAAPPFTGPASLGPGFGGRGSFLGVGGGAMPGGNRNNYFPGLGGPGGSGGNQPQPFPGYGDSPQRPRRPGGPQ